MSSSLYKPDSYFSSLVGLTLKSVTGLEVGNDSVEFESVDGRKFSMYHNQDCCESVRVEDVCGDVNDLIGSPILQAEENSNDIPEPPAPAHAESFTWTFYRIATIKGQVVIRWLGESNGYYSERVSFKETTK